MATLGRMGALLVLVAAGAGAAAGSPAVGTRAVDFTLKTPEGRAVRLGALTAKSPVALVVLRGYPGYQCPFCTRQVAGLLARAADVRAAGAQVLLVYPGPGEGLDRHATKFVAGRALPDGFTLVLDPDYAFTRQYGLRWEAPNETAYPSTFIIDRGGVVRFSLVSRSHGGRAGVDQILAQLRAARP